VDTVENSAHLAMFRPEPRPELWNSVRSGPLAAHDLKSLACSRRHPEGSAKALDQRVSASSRHDSGDWPASSLERPLRGTWRGQARHCLGICANHLSSGPHECPGGILRRPSRSLDGGSRARVRLIRYAINPGYEPAGASRETDFPHFQQKTWCMRGRRSSVLHVFNSCGLSCGKP
jgi:hypothetical protein